jgi:transketolase
VKALRDHFRDELIARASVDPRIVAIDCDVHTHSRLTDFAAFFPDRFYQAGASEQHAISLAAGLARAGRVPVVASFATFISAQAFEQARNSIGLQDLPILVVGSHAGFAAGEDGASRQAYDDMALVALIPAFHVHAPADLADLREALDAAIVHKRPVYMRYGRRPLLPLPNPHAPAAGFRLLTPGWRVVAVTTGEVVHDALDALKGLDVSIVHTARVRPLPELLRRCSGPSSTS